MVLHNAVAQQHLAFHCDIERAADTHNQQYDNGRLDAGQCDVPDAF